MRYVSAVTAKGNSSYSYKSQEHAELRAKMLDDENCTNCIECVACVECNFCNSCNYCDFCNSCNYCNFCDYCDFCDRTSNQKGISK